MQKANTTVNQEAQNKTQELILYMDNTQQVFNSYKEPWIKNYTKKVRKGIFNIEDGITGMKYLMKNVQKEYNKELGTDKEGKIPDIYIEINKDEKRTIQIAFLESVLNDIVDNVDIETQEETIKLIKSLKGFF